MNKLSKLLLATTCLTAVNAAPAAAVSEVEPNNTLATAQPLPLGTTQITGTLLDSSFNSAHEDFYSLGGLQAGQNFVVTLSAASGGAIMEAPFFGVQNTTGTILDVDQLVQGRQLTGAVPGDGILIVHIAGLTGNEQTFNYTIDINAPRLSVPEPSVLSLLAAGAAGLGIVRRRSRKRPQR